MKAIITADLHLVNELNSLSQRHQNAHILNFEQQLIFFDRIFHIKPDLFIIAGDLLDYSVYTPSQLDKIITIFKKLKEAGILIIFIQGNHDLDYPFLEKLKTYAVVVANEDNKNSGFIMPDFKIVYKKLLFDKTLFHFVNYTESRKLLKKIEFDNSKYNVLIAHTLISGLKNDSNAPIFCELAPSDFVKFYHVFTGHIHHRQDFKNITVIGSPYMKNSAYYNVILYDTQTGRHNRIEINI